MIILEITSEKKEYAIIPGLYKIGEEISDGVLLCEYNGIFEGIVEITRNSILKTYIYDLSDRFQIKKGYTEYTMPNTKFNKYWSLFTHSEIQKNGLLTNFLKLFMVEQYDLTDLFSFNKSFLLYGPPGSGKSTISRAVVQKASIRLERKFVMKEINCSEIFSKFYGESLEIFNRIFDESEKDTIFIIDEIESIMSKRSLLFNKNEPNDSIRLINAFLTILDKRSFIFIFTSNFLEELDLAFVDRCDYIEEIRCGSEEIVYKLVVDMLDILKNKNLLECSEFMSYKEVSTMIPIKKYLDGIGKISMKLLMVVRACFSLSIRQIKKIIFESIEIKKMKIIDFLENLEKNATKRIQLFNNEKN